MDVSFCTKVYLNPDLYDDKNLIFSFFNLSSKICYQEQPVRGRMMNNELFFFRTE
jgi:hypothetical protein